MLRQKMLDGLSSPPPPLTRRDVRLPAVPGKALAVIGVRRSGRTTLMWQCLADRLAAGPPLEALAYNSLVQSWPEITRLVREGGQPPTEQPALFGSP